MIILNLETSLSPALISGFNKDGCIFHEFIDQDGKASHILLQKILHILKKNSLSLSDITTIAVGLGPGSFLGTRIGVILAKSLAYGLDISLFGYCSLSLYIPKKEGSFFVLSDAKSKGVYALKGLKKKNSVSFDASPVLYSIDELLINLTDEILITAQHELKEKDMRLAKKLSLVSPDFSYLHQKFLREISPLESRFHPLDDLEIHYLRLN